MEYLVRRYDEVIQAAVVVPTGNPQVDSTPRNQAHATRRISIHALNYVAVETFCPR